MRPRCHHGRFLGTNGCKECGLFRCPRCMRVVGWEEGGTDNEYCAKCWTETRPTTCIDPDCAHTTGHTEDCALSFGDAFAQREGEVPV